MVRVKSHPQNSPSSPDMGNKLTRTSQVQIWSSNNMVYSHPSSHLPTPYSHQKRESCRSSCGAHQKLPLNARHVERLCSWPPHTSCGAMPWLISRIVDERTLKSTSVTVKPLRLTRVPFTFVHFIPTSEVKDACEWPQCGCLSTVRLAPRHVVVGQSPDRWGDSL